MGRVPLPRWLVQPAQQVLRWPLRSMALIRRALPQRRLALRPCLMLGFLAQVKAQLQLQLQLQLQQWPQ